MCKLILAHGLYHCLKANEFLSMLGNIAKLLILLKCTSVIDFKLCYDMSKLSLKQFII